jgi:hypothetical protein
MNSVRKNVISFIKNRWWFLAAIAIGVIGVGALLISTSTAQAQPTQPIAFNHQAMVQLGIDCQFCHTEARRSEAAGMPSVAKCMGCHKVIDPNNPEIQKVKAYWDKGQPIPWARVNQLPRFVYFSHEVHVTAGGIDCAACHGDVGHMGVAHPVVRMDMGWCLSCHQKQANAKQLTECITCHQ